jgi:hypothetical protein
VCAQPPAAVSARAWASAVCRARAAAASAAAAIPDGGPGPALPGVLGDGQGDPAGQPGTGRRFTAGRWRSVAGRAGMAAARWRAVAAAAAGDAGDGEGLPGGVGDDDPPLRGGVGGGGAGELAGLVGGDGADAAQQPGRGGESGQGGPGQGEIQQPGHRPPVR